MRMKSFSGLLAILASAWAISSASAADQPTPPSQGLAVENVIVTEPRFRTEKALDNFIIGHAKPSPFLGKIARWKKGICPVTLGLPDKFDLYVTQRIIRVAMAAGAPLDQHEPCRPNVAVLATPQPQQLLDFIRQKRVGLLGFHYRPQAEQLATMRLPIQAWYSTATEDFMGLISADIPDGALGYGVMSPFGRLPFMSVSGSRTGDGLKSEFTTAIIVVDSSKIAGQEIGPIADYIAMLTLAQGRYYDSCQDVPTITNLMAPGCEAQMKPAAITDVDMTYLRGLYRMDAGSSYIGQRGSIAFEMKKDLGGY
jgi:hypothetical protein